MITPREKARHGLLLDGLGNVLDLNAVDWHVRQQNPAASPSEVQNETLEVIWSLVNDGLVTLGSMPHESEHSPERFVAWNHPLDHSMHKISHVYVRHYDDPERWMYSVWLKLTDKGEQLAQSIEKKDLEGYK